MVGYKGGSGLEVGLRQTGSRKNSRHKMKLILWTATSQVCMFMFICVWWNNWQDARDDSSRAEFPANSYCMS